MKKISSSKNFLDRVICFIGCGQNTSAALRLPMAHSLCRSLLSRATILAGLAWLPSQASTIMTQTFTDSWAVEPTFYENQTSAWQWSYTPYIPWDASLGTLTGVNIHTTVTGERKDPTEAVFLRTAFFTGWDPDQYQYEKTDSIAPGLKDFSYDYAVSLGGADLNAWLNPDYLPQAYYYFESRTLGAGHSVDAVTTLDYIYEPGSPSSVPDGGSTALVLGGSVVGLLTLRRRHANSSQLSLSGLSRA